MWSNSWRCPGGGRDIYVHIEANECRKKIKNKRSPRNKISVKIDRNFQMGCITCDGNPCGSNRIYTSGRVVKAGGL